ncbi:MAG: MFS transporter [Aquiluna sp.]|nr:MFS transporter [Aquiluna sp.]
MQRKVAPFVYLQLASITSVISGSMVFISFPWVALELTGSAGTAGFVVAMTAIPALLMAPLIGSVIDRFGRRFVAIWAELFTALTVILIPIIAGIWELTVASLIAVGVFRAVFAPGGSTSRKSLVPDTAAPANMSLDRANSIHEGLFATGFAIGPALATLLIASIGSANTFLIVALFGVLSSLFASLIRVHEQHEENDETEKEPFFKYALQGFKVLAQNPGVMVMMAAIMTLAIIYLPTEMVVLPAYYNLLGDPEGLGLAISVGAAASIIGALGFEQIHKRVSFKNILRIGILGIGLAMIPMSLLPSQFWMVFFFGVLGLAWGPLMPLLNTVIQQKIPANKRGRVFALEMTIWQAGPLLTMVAVGLAVDGFGVGPVYMVLAASVVIAGLLVSFNRYIKQLNS